MVHSGPKAKAHLKKKSKLQLMALVLYLLTILKMTSPKAYRQAEKRAGLKYRSVDDMVATVDKKHRGPPKGKVPPQLRPYLFKKGHRKVRKKSRH